eukprot:956258-Amphidinium_carterae.1
MAGPHTRETATLPKAIQKMAICHTVGGTVVVLTPRAEHKFSSRKHVIVELSAVSVVHLSCAKEPKWR